MDPLFPELPGPQDLEAMTPEEVQALLEQHEIAAEKINADDEEFLGDYAQPGREAEIIAEYEKGVEQIKQLRVELAGREEAAEAYKAKIAELAAEAKAVEVKAEEEEDGGEEEAAEEEAAAEGEGEENGDEDAASVEAKELEPALAAATTNQAQEVTTANVTKVRFSRTPPAPAPERVHVSTPEPAGTALVAAGQFRADYPEPFTPDTLADAMANATRTYGPLAKTEPAGKYVSEIDFGQIETYADGRREHVGEIKTIIWDGPKHKVAEADFPFPEDRTLDGDGSDIEKIRNVLPATTSWMGKPGGHGGEALVASGGLCAPLEPFYTMPNFGTEAEPVWDSLPVFRARRGGVNTPDATYVADITTAISSISEANDALGGTFATKSCQDLTCPAYTEVAVQILAHCREYGNLNARAWPEKIAHENALTMQALSRTSEGFMLDRLKALSVNVTNGGTGQGALIYTVEAIVRASFGIRGRLRMPRESRFRAVMPYWVPDILVLDNVSTQFDRYRDRDSLVAYLRSVGIDPVFYLDTPSTGTTQLPDASQTAAAIDATPANFQWAFYPEGAFLGIDSGTLELGIVRDSTLNSTNDFQVFGERFRNVARLGPAQSAYWITTTYCAAGIFPALGTARTCP